MYNRWACSVASALVLCAGAARAADWEATTEDFLKKVKPGYGGLSGIVVDHASGDVYACVSDRGVFRSADRGSTWKQVDKPFKGRTEWPGSMMLHGSGKGQRLIVATVYGAPIAEGSADGKAWKFMNPKSSHVDWCALDWADGGKFVLALKHESGGLLIASHDGGKTFQDVGKAYGPAWVFDGKTAVVAQMKTRENAKPGLLRTTDAGKTFTACGGYHAQALPKWQDGTLYWLTEEGLITSADRGSTWKKVAAVKGGRYGPVFGKDGKHLFLLTSAGIIESRDGGASWGKPVALPKDLKGGGTLCWIDYDPVGEVLYTMKMGSQLYRMTRK